MRDLNTQLLKVDDLLERTADRKLVFRKRYTADEITSNKHYLVKDKNFIVQINSNFQRIGCHDKNFQRVSKFKATDAMMLTLIKNLILTDKQFILDLDTDTDDDFYYFEEELQVLKRGDSTKEEYINRILKNKEEILEALKVITIWDKEHNCQFKVYRLGGSFYQPNKEADALGALELTLYLGKLFEIIDSVNDLEEITMLEKDIIPHEYSKLYVLMEYLKENKESLPNEINAVLDTGLEDGLTKLGESFKESRKYAR